MVSLASRAVAPAVAALLAVGFVSSAWGDPVTDHLQQAEAAYAQKNFAAALTALNAATTLVRQMKAEAWKVVLPDPPPGWTAEDAKVITVGPALLGGGSATERRYHHPGGSVDVSLIADSPMLQSVAQLLGAGMLVSGADPLVIEGQRASYNANENSLQAIVADKVLVKVQGSRGVDKQTLQDFFRAIKLRDIEKASQ